MQYGLSSNSLTSLKFNKAASRQRFNLSRGTVSFIRFGASKSLTRRKNLNITNSKLPNRDKTFYNTHLLRRKPSQFRNYVLVKTDVCFTFNRVAERKNTVHTSNDKLSTNYTFASLRDDLVLRLLHTLCGGGVNSRMNFLPEGRLTITDLNITRFRLYNTTYYSNFLQTNVRNLLSPTEPETGTQYMSNLLQKQTPQVAYNYKECVKDSEVTKKNSFSLALS